MHTLIPWYSIPVLPFMNELANSYPTRTYAEGTCLLETMCVATHFMVIREGLCQCQLKGRNLNTVGFLGADSSFGEVQCISPLYSQGCYTTLSSSKIVCVPREILVSHLEQNIVDSNAFTRYVIEKTHQLWKTVTLFMCLNVKERLLYFLNSCVSAKPVYSPCGEYLLLVPQLSQTQIADMLGINRITLAKTLRPLRESGLIKLQGPHFMVRRDCLDSLAYLRGIVFPPIRLD